MIRTTYEDHKRAVQAFWSKISSSIHVGTHEGLYSTNEETFMVEKDLRVEDGLWRTEVGEVLERVSESNYVFRIAEVDRQKVRAWAKQEGTVVPASARNKVLDDLERQNPDISVSRPLERLEWGIKVPADAS